MNIMGYMNETGMLFRGPVEYFRRLDPENSLRPTLRLFLFLLLGATVLLFLAALANLSTLKEASVSMHATIPGLQSGGFANATPWNRLIFPLFWFVLIALTGLFRHATVTLFGESNRLLATTQAISFAGFVPGIVLFTLSGLIATFFPAVPGSMQGAGVRFSIWISLISVILSIILDARICISGFKLRYGQNSGRAFVTWISPVLITGFTFFVLYALIIVLVVMRTR
ncbi:MAG: hypothetical protein K8S54_14560 [Spirochaetia bacterium]|nr:hypothetical protein [Spirochaetia bacterium]